MLREELDDDESWVMGRKKGKEAWKFERKLKDGKGGKIAKKC